MTTKIRIIALAICITECVIRPAVANGSPERCPIINAYEPFVAAARETQGQGRAPQLAAFSGVAARFPGLYSQAVLGLAPGPPLDEKVIESFEKVRRDGSDSELRLKAVADLNLALSSFDKFRDFRCDFPIYFADTLGQLDGAGRRVDGRASLVIGVDALRSEAASISLRVLFAHELFHRYHSRAGGFSDDPGEHQPIWRTLWAEGLATYASQQLTAGASTDQALLLPPDLAQRAAPLTPKIASALLIAFDRVDPQVFRTYFTYGRADVTKRGLPWRSGYYVGYRVAQLLATRLSLSQLAHLRGAAARDRVRAALRTLARGEPSAQIEGIR